jgi:hypothetical protein
MLTPCHQRRALLGQAAGSPPSTGPRTRPPRTLPPPPSLPLPPIAVGEGPEALVFDESNVWVANNLDNTVTKLRASDGLTLGTFPVGRAPFGVAFDGANVWVTKLLQRHRDEAGSGHRSATGNLLRGRRTHRCGLRWAPPLGGEQRKQQRHVAAAERRCAARHCSRGGGAIGLIAAAGLTGTAVWTANFGNDTISMMGP